MPKKSTNPLADLLNQQVKQIEESVQKSSDELQIFWTQQATQDVANILAGDPEGAEEFLQEIADAEKAILHHVQTGEYPEGYENMGVEVLDFDSLPPDIQAKIEAAMKESEEPDPTDN